MGGWMTWNRARNRNGLDWKPPLDEDPYIRTDEQRRAAGVDDRVSLTLLGDLNRMERGYCAPDQPPADPRHDLNVGGRVENSPLHECAAATGVDVETVRRVLTHVFRGSH